MDLNEAISLLRKTVKNNSTTDMNHIDLGLVPAEQRGKYEKALRIVKMAIMNGKISQDEFAARIHLN